MSKPFNQYIIKSSHNSYLNSCQICGIKYDENYILKILNADFKSIELDIHCIQNEIVVYHGTSCCICSKPILFSHLLDLIEQYIIEHPDTLPIFVFLELNTTDQDKVYDIIIDTLKNRIPDHKINLFNELPNSFRGNVLFCCGGNLLSDKLKEIIQLTYVYQLFFCNNPAGEQPLSFYETGINNFIFRIYPKNFMLSKNYDPTPYLDIGCQFVCLNYQTTKFKNVLEEFFKESNGYVERKI
jgi:hypothetical protein